MLQLKYAFLNFFFFNIQNYIGNIVQLKHMHFFTEESNFERNLLKFD